MSSPLRAVIFDFDGTLLDSFPAIVAAFNAALEPIHRRTWSPAEVIAHFGLPDIPMVSSEFPADIADADRQAALERYFAAYERAHDQIVPFDGVTELLQSLAGRGIPMGVMTGKGSRAAHISLRYVGWEKYFGSVVTGDDIAEQKPHPEGALRVAQELGIDPGECAFVGDSPADIGAGENAGMFSIVAGWHDYYAAELRQMKPDLWPHTPLELRDWTLKHVVAR